MSKKFRFCRLNITITCPRPVFKLISKLFGFSYLDQIFITDAWRKEQKNFSSNQWDYQMWISLGPIWWEPNAAKIFKIKKTKKIKNLQKFNYTQQHNPIIVISGRLLMKGFLLTEQGLDTVTLLWFPINQCGKLDCIFAQTMFERDSSPNKRRSLYLNVN